VLLSTLLQDILHPPHPLLNVLLQTENKLGLNLKKKKKKKKKTTPQDMVTARQRLGKHVPVSTNMHTTTEELLEVVFLMWSMTKL
jgi:hypothetical protein